MNLEADRTKSRKPPGGESSNIFGEPDIVVRQSAKANPSFHSSIFTEDKAMENTPKAKSIAQDQKYSNILVNSEEEKEPKASTSTFQGELSKSSVFKELNYPQNPKCEPGVSCKLNAAYKPANNTILSSIFTEDFNALCAPKKKHFSYMRASSSVFDPLPEATANLSKPVSKTFKSSIGKDAEERRFLNCKRPSACYNQSVLVPGCCDVDASHSSPIVFASDSSKAFMELKEPSKTPTKFDSSSFISTVEIDCSSNKNSQTQLNQLWSSGPKPVVMSSCSSKNNVSNKYFSQVFDKDSFVETQHATKCNDSAIFLNSKNPEKHFFNTMFPSAAPIFNLQNCGNKTFLNKNVDSSDTKQYPHYSTFGLGVSSACGSADKCYGKQYSLSVLPSAKNQTGEAVVVHQSDQTFFRSMSNGNEVHDKVASNFHNQNSKVSQSFEGHTESSHRNTGAEQNKFTQTDKPPTESYTFPNFKLPTFSLGKDESNLSLEDNSVDKAKPEKFSRQFVSTPSLRDLSPSTPNNKTRYSSNVQSFVIKPGDALFQPKLFSTPLLPCPDNFNPNTICGTRQNRLTITRMFSNDNETSKNFLHDQLDKKADVISKAEVASKTKGIFSFLQGFTATAPKDQTGLSSDNNGIAENNLRNTELSTSNKTHVAAQRSHDITKETTESRCTNVPQSSPAAPYVLDSGDVLSHQKTFSTILAPCNTNLGEICGTRQSRLTITRSFSNETKSTHSMAMSEKSDKTFSEIISDRETKQDLSPSTTTKATLSSKQDQSPSTTAKVTLPSNQESSHVSENTVAPGTPLPKSFNRSFSDVASESTVFSSQLSPSICPEHKDCPPGAKRVSVNLTPSQAKNSTSKVASKSGSTDEEKRQDHSSVSQTQKFSSLQLKEKSFNQPDKNTSNSFATAEKDLSTKTIPSTATAPESSLFVTFRPSGIETQTKLFPIPLVPSKCPDNNCSCEQCTVTMRQESSSSTGYAATNFSENQPKFSKNNVITFNEKPVSTPKKFDSEIVHLQPVEIEKPSTSQRTSSTAVQLDKTISEKETDSYVNEKLKAKQGSDFSSSQSISVTPTPLQTEGQLFSISVSPDSCSGGDNSDDQGKVLTMRNEKAQEKSDVGAKAAKQKQVSENENAGKSSSIDKPFWKSMFTRSSQNESVAPNDLKPSRVTSGVGEEPQIKQDLVSGTLTTQKSKKHQVDKNRSTVHSVGMSSSEQVCHDELFSTRLSPICAQDQVKLETNRRYTVTAERQSTSLHKEVEKPTEYNRDSKNNSNKDEDKIVSFKSNQYSSFVPFNFNFSGWQLYKTTPEVDVSSASVGGESRNKPIDGKKDSFEASNYPAAASFGMLPSGVLSQGKIISAYRQCDSRIDVEKHKECITITRDTFSSNQKISKQESGLNLSQSKDNEKQATGANQVDAPVSNRSEKSLSSKLFNWFPSKQSSPPTTEKSQATPLFTTEQKPVKKVTNHDNLNSDADFKRTVSVESGVSKTHQKMNTQQNVPAFAQPLRVSASQSSAVPDLPRFTTELAPPKKCPKHENLSPDLDFKRIVSIESINSKKDKKIIIQQSKPAVAGQKTAPASLVDNAKGIFEPSQSPVAPSPNVLTIPFFATQLEPVQKCPQHDHLNPDACLKPTVLEDSSSSRKNEPVISQNSKPVGAESKSARITLRDDTKNSTTTMQASASQSPDISSPSLFTTELAPSQKCPKHDNLNPDPIFKLTVSNDSGSSKKDQKITPQLKPAAAEPKTAPITVREGIKSSNETLQTPLSQQPVSLFTTDLAPAQKCPKHDNLNPDPIFKLTVSKDTGSSRKDQKMITPLNKPVVAEPKAAPITSRDGAKNSTEALQTPVSQPSVSLFTTELAPAQKCPQHDNSNADVIFKVTVSRDSGSLRKDQKMITPQNKLAVVEPKTAPVTLRDDVKASTETLQTPASQPPVSFFTSELVPAQKCPKHDNLNPDPEFKLTVSKSNSTTRKNQTMITQQNHPAVAESKTAALAFGDDTEGSRKPPDALAIDSLEEAQIKFFKMKSPPTWSNKIFSSRLVPVKCPDKDEYFPRNKCKLTLSIGKSRNMSASARESSSAKEKTSKPLDSKITDHDNKLNMKTNQVSVAIQSRTDATLSNQNETSISLPFFKFTGIETPPNVFSTTIAPECAQSSEDESQCCVLSVARKELSSNQAVEITGNAKTQEGKSKKSFWSSSFSTVESDANSLDINSKSSWKFWKNWNKSSSDSANSTNQQDDSFERPISRSRNVVPAPPKLVSNFVNANEFLPTQTAVSGKKPSGEAVTSANNPNLTGIIKDDNKYASSHSLLPNSAFSSELIHCSSYQTLPPRIDLALLSDTDEKHNNSISYRHTHNAGSLPYCVNSSEKALLLQKPSSKPLMERSENAALTTGKKTFSLKESCMASKKPLLNQAPSFGLIKKQSKISAKQAFVGPKISNNQNGFSKVFNDANRNQTQNPPQSSISFNHSKTHAIKTSSRISRSAFHQTCFLPNGSYGLTLSKKDI